jgi:hypothetical protein
MERVIIGVNPHKLSATIEVVDQRETVLGSGRFTTDKAGFSAMRKYPAVRDDDAPSPRRTSRTRMIR